MAHDDPFREASQQLTNISYRMGNLVGHGPTGILAINAVSTQAGKALPFVIEVDGNEITVKLSAADVSRLKRHLKQSVRREKRRAANASSAANVAQQIGIGIGGGLFVAGGIAMITVSAPLLLAAAVATGVGAVVTAAGVASSHLMNGRKHEYEEKVERYEDMLEELK